MRKIKILYVNTDLTRGSGGDTHPLVLAKHIDRSRFDFRVCVIEAASSSFISEMERCGCPLYSMGLSRRFYNPLGLIRVIYRLSRLFAKIGPDIVQTQALHANLLARPAALWAGVPVVISTENSLPDIERNALLRVFNAPLHGLNRLLDRSTQRIVVVSEWVRQWKDPTGQSRKICVIAPPLRLDAVGTGERPRPLGRRVLDGGAPMLGVVGRLSPEKGHGDLIAAMPAILAQAPAAQLLIAGSGPLEAKLRAQVEALDLTKSVHFLGYVSEIRTVFARLDLLVVPSLSEAFSLVTLEGMVMGLPIVAARAGGIAELVLDGETGLLVPPGQTAALSAACQHLLSHPDLGRQMGERGRQRALSTFHPTEFVARHEELYTSALPADCRNRESRDVSIKHA